MVGKVAESQWSSAATESGTALSRPHRHIAAQTGSSAFASSSEALWQNRVKELPAFTDVVPRHAVTLLGSMPEREKAWE